MSGPYKNETAFVQLMLLYILYLPIITSVTTVKIKRLSRTQEQEKKNILSFTFQKNIRCKNTHPKYFNL